MKPLAKTLSLLSLVLFTSMCFSLSAHAQYSDFSNTVFDKGTSDDFNATYGIGAGNVNNQGTGATSAGNINNQGTTALDAGNVNNQGSGKVDVRFPGI